MVRRLAGVGVRPHYWLVLLVLSLSMEGLALFFQHVLGYGPCVLCIHIRIGVLCLALVALAGLALRGAWIGRVVAHGLVTVVAAGLLERSWLLLGIELGRVDGECSFDLGLPAWLALDRWVPPLFEVQEACGVTPPLPFGFTMAEVLPVVSGGLLLISAALLLATLLRGRRS
ncbi:MAG: disulfide bond formation protein B [Thiogranum sp.]